MRSWPVSGKKVFSCIAISANRSLEWDIALSLWWWKSAHLRRVLQRWRRKLPKLEILEARKFPTTGSFRHWMVARGVYKAVDLKLGCAVYSPDPMGGIVDHPVFEHDNATMAEDDPKLRLDQPSGKA
jgi:hypothetical protein